MNSEAQTTTFGHSGRIGHLILMNTMTKDIVKPNELAVVPKLILLGDH